MEPEVEVTKPQEEDPYDANKLFENTQFRTHFERLQSLKEKLSSIKYAKNNPDKMKELEPDFLGGLKQAISELNIFSSQLVTEIIESLNFINRKLDGHEKLDPSLHNMLSGDIDDISLKIVNLHYFAQLTQAILLELTRRHDSIVGFSSSAWFSNILQNEPFSNVNFSALILRLSEVYYSIKEGLKVHAEPGSDSQQYKVRTAKFWVRKSDIVKLKAMIVKYLPARLWVEPTPDTPFDEITDSRKYSSIYLDNEKFSLLGKILNEDNGASQLRVEWYDDLIDKANIELKIYPDWESEATENFSLNLKEKRIVPFLKGEWDFKGSANKLLTKGVITQEQYGEQTKIAEQIQQVVEENDLTAVLRLDYQRCVYQNLKSPGLRIVLDDEVILTKFQMGRWNLTTPANQKDQSIFPFAILQVKFADTCPEWVTKLEHSPVVVPIDGHFSKFIYGIGKFYFDQLHTLGLELPSWFPKIEKTQQQLRKKHGIIFRKSRTEREISGDDDDSSSSDNLRESEEPTALDNVLHFRSHTTPSRIRYQGTTTPIPTTTSQPINTSILDDKPKPKLKPKPKPQEIQPGLRPVRTPVKVEPKTFFANERTLLQWLNAIVVLTTVAIAMIGLGDDRARLAGLILLPISLCFALYSLVMYHVRRLSILEHRTTPAYDDRVGPYALVVVFITATVISVVVPIVNGDMPAMDYSRAPYPPIPGYFPVTPKVINYIVPLPVEMFENRTEGLHLFGDYLNSLSSSFKLTYDVHSESDKIQTITYYTTPVNNITSYFTLVRQGNGLESDTRFFLNWKIPNFRKLTPPEVIPGLQGVDYYGMDFFCKETVFYSLSEVNGIPELQSFGDLDKYIMFAKEDLKVDSSVPLVIDNSIGFKSVAEWKVDAMLDGVVCSIWVHLFYESSYPKHGEVPVDATFQLQLIPHAQGKKILEEARLVAIKTIYQQWGSWPQRCLAG